MLVSVGAALASTAVLAGAEQSKAQGTTAASKSEGSPTNAARSGSRPPVRREVQPARKPPAKEPGGQTGNEATAAGAPAVTTPGQQAPATGAPAPGQTGQAGSAPAPGQAAGQPAPAPGTAAAAAPAPPPDAWSKEEIAAAKAHCAAVLKGVEAQFADEEPIKHGACGAPAPIKVTSIGKGPEITLAPPVTMTCDMVAALAKWIKADMQPLARKHLGGPVVRIETMSSYSCRNAYGRAKTNLSEHGRANAVDIGAFATAAGEPTRVLTSWGLTAREVRAIAAKAEAEKAAAAAAAAKAQAAGAAQPAESGKSPPAPAAGASPAPSAQGGSAAIAAPSLRPGLPAGATTLSLTPGAKLGGPKSNEAATQPAQKSATPAAGPAGTDKPDAESRRTKFLREAHSSACRHFGTVLGPEANNAHKNHFHLDMAQRRSGAFCE